MIRRQRRSVRRPPAEWAARAGLSIVAALLAYAGISRTLAQVWRGNSAYPHALAPEEGRITAALARELSAAQPDASAQARADRLAQQALRQDATAVVAAATLGLDRQIRGDIPHARALLIYAQRLSRRDLPTQIWAIEDAVGRGDVTGALHHYDIALRTSRAAPDLLFPVLASAIADRQVRDALMRTLAAKPIWTAAFVHYVAVGDLERRAVADLLFQLRRRGVPVTAEASAAVITGLMAQGSTDTAWTYYASLHPGVDRHISRDPTLIADPAAASVFDWTPIEAAGVSSSLQRDDRGGLFDFAVAASVDGPLLRQIQMLPPGDYALAGHSIGIDQPDETTPYWMLACSGGRELGRVAVPSSIKAAGHFAGRFTVPADCPVQSLTLIAQASNAIGGLTGQIDRIQLMPVR